MVSVFDYDQYKAFLNAAIRNFPLRGHGVRLKLAKFLNCQSTYVSKVLNAEADFNLEQAEKLGRFFHLSELENEYFILLVHEARAGTSELKSFYEKNRKKILEARKVMKNRFTTPQPLSPEDQARYYSAWYYSAIHVLLTIPEFRERDVICRRLGLALPLVNEVLEFLLSIGLVSMDNGKYIPSSTRMYLGNDSPLIAKLHQNWRLQAIMHLDQAKSDDLHYSTVVSLSERDFSKIRELLVKTIADLRDKIRESKEEKLCSLCMDFYEI